MRRLIASTGIAAGLLLVVVPLYVFPPCERLGFARMHCSDTARAEIILGALLLTAGALAFAAKRLRSLVANAAVLCAILALAWSAPDHYGYCMSPKMPCHYGMVPSVRFIAAVAGVVLVTAMALLAKGMRTKKEAS